MGLCFERRGSAWKKSLANARFAPFARLALFALFALVALSLSTTPSRASAAACKLQTFELPVKMVGTRAVTTLGINGTDVPLVVDSGAFFSILTHAAAQQLDLRIDPLPFGFHIEGVTGRVDAGMTTVKRVKVGNGEIPNVDFVVGGNAENNGTMGYLGRNFLAFADVEYDLAHSAIRLVFPTGDCGDTMMAYWAGDKPVASLKLLDEHKTKTPAIVGTAQLNGKKLDVLFDTGAMSSVSLKAAKRAGITDMTPAGKIRGAGRGEADRWTATADRFELGGEAISNVRLEVADFDLDDADMLLGIDFFLSHRIYISKKQRRMYFTYNGGPVFMLTALEIAKAAAKHPAAASAPGEPAASAPGALASASLDEPKDAAGYAQRAAVSAARLDYASALADLDRACEMAPQTELQTAQYFARRGLLHEMLHQGQAAVKDYDTALQIDPAQTQARMRRATLRAAFKNRDGAIEDLQALDKQLTPQATERQQIGQLYQRFEMYEAALPQWSAWITAHPKDIELGGVYSNRCWARVLLNVELKEALDDCDEAIDLDDKDAGRYDVRGWLRLRRGELRKALGDYNRSVELRPNNAWTLYGRGIVRRKQGDVAGGQADIEAARKLLPAIDVNMARYGLDADRALAAPSP